MSEIIVRLGNSNKINERRTPIYLEFEEQKFHGIVIDNNDGTYIRWGNKVPEHIRKKSPEFLSIYRETISKEKLHEQAV